MPTEYRQMHKFIAIALLAALCACATPGRPVSDRSTGYGDLFTAQDLADSPVRGDPDAPVTIVEFSDFQCFFCWLSEATIKRVLEDYKGKVRLVWIHTPLHMHPNAYVMSAASIVAQQQNAFWPFHDVVFQSQAEWGSLGEEALGDKLQVLAEVSGLDMPRFVTDFGNRDLYAAKIERDADLARRLKVRGTPTFFVDGERLVGAQPYEKFAAAVEAALKRR